VSDKREVIKSTRTVVDLSGCLLPLLVLLGGPLILLVGALIVQTVKYG
jgi:hypothetical protein